MDVPFQDRGHGMTTERRTMTFFYARCLSPASLRVPAISRATRLILFQLIQQLGGVGQCRKARIVQKRRL